MIGHLATAIGLDHRDPVVAQKMLAPPGKSQRVNRRMLGQPDLVPRCRVARGGEVLHRAPRRRVIGPAETADDDAPDPIDASRRVFHSTTLTIGCATSSR